jgi:hypothetical protein
MHDTERKSRCMGIIRLCYFQLVITSTCQHCHNFCIIRHMHTCTPYLDLLQRVVGFHSFEKCSIFFWDQYMTRSSRLKKRIHEHEHGGAVCSPRGMWRCESCIALLAYVRGCAVRSKHRTRSSCVRDTGEYYARERHCITTVRRTSFNRIHAIVGTVPPTRTMTRTGVRVSACVTM